MCCAWKWHTGILLAALLAAAALAWAQDKEGGAQAPPATPVPVYGTVFLPDGSPAGDAEVELHVWREELLRITTDAGGRYAADLPGTGTYVLEARLCGVGVSKRLVARALDPEQAVTLDIHLYPAPVLAGIVYTEDGAPAANLALESYGARGRVEHVPPADGIPPEQADYGAIWAGGKIGPPITTDGLGRYSVPLLDASGDTAISFSLPFEGDGTEHRLILLAPGGLGWAKLEVRADLDIPEVRHDIHLQPGARVSGTLLGYPGGAAVSGVTVRVGMDLAWMMHNWPTVEELVTDEKGRFHAAAALPPDLLFAWPVLEKGWAIVDQEWQPADEAAVGDRHVTISLVSDSTIEGRLFAPDGSPLAHAHVVFPEVGSVDTDGEGHYRLDLEARFGPYGLPPGRPRYIWLAPRVPGTGVATPVRVDVTQEPLTFDFLLAPPATVTGDEIEQDEGLKAVGVRVRLVPAVEGVPPRELEQASRLCFDDERSVTNDDDTGVYRLEGVPPGEYWLETSDWTIHSLTVEKGNAPRVTVPRGGTVTVDTIHVDYLPRFNVNLVGGPSDLASYEVTGFARPAGSSGPGDEIFVWPWPEERDRYLVWARHLDPGRYDLVIVARKESSRYVTVLHTMDLTGQPPGEDLSFDLGGAAIAGRVTMPDGVTGIPHITVTARAYAGEAVILHGRMHDWGHFQVEADDDGSFSIAGLLPGRYELRAHLPQDFYGAPPTLRLALWVNQRAEVVLRAERVEW